MQNVSMVEGASLLAGLLNTIRATLTPEQVFEQEDIEQAAARISSPGSVFGDDEIASYANEFIPAGDIYTVEDMRQAIQQIEEATSEGDDDV